MSITASRGKPRPRRGVSLGRIVSGLVLLGVVAVVVGQLLGHPLLLAFVETGSMRPTITTGDGFLTVPPVMAGEIGAGDIIIYRAEEIGGGGLTTHRVVDVTDEGFITAGDANAFTDQAAGEPVVTRDAVVAVVVQVAGHPVVVPGLGTVIGGVGDAIRSVQVVLADLFGTRAFLGVQGLAFLLLAASVVGYFADVILATPQKPRSRGTDRRAGYRVSRLLIVVGVLVGAAATVAMVAPSGSAVYAFDSVAPSANVEGGIPAGQQHTIEATVSNAGLIPTYVIYDSVTPGVTVPADPIFVWPRERTTVPITLSAPMDPGRYEREVVQHRYLTVLPPTVVEALHEVHPWAAIVTIDAIVVFLFLGIGRLLVGGGRLRVRPARDRDHRFRLRRWLWGPGD